MFFTFALGAIKLLMGGASFLSGFLQKQSDNALEAKRIQSNENIETMKAKVQAIVSYNDAITQLGAQGTQRQLAKFNHPVFWVLIVSALGPGILHVWVLTLYNWLWWKNGVWPQPWLIAEFPPQAAAWVDMSIRWLFDPVALPVTVGTAIAGGILAGRR